MNQHHFQQFNPNGYKKHLSPFGRSFLDTLLRHFRTGFESNENRRRHQFTANQNRRQCARDYNHPQSIPSVPSSPRNCNNDEIGNHRIADFFHANDHLIPPVPADRGAHSSSRRIHIDFVEETNQGTGCNYNNFEAPRLPTGLPFAPTKFVNNYDLGRDLRVTEQFTNSDSLIHQNAERQTFSNILPEVPISHLFSNTTDCEIPNQLVPTVTDLTKTVEISNTIEEEILTANDMITQVINFDNINEKLLSSKKYINTDIPAKTFLKMLDEAADGKNDPGEDVTKRIENDVDWDDMFDTELFQNLNDPLPKITPELDDKGNNFKIEFPNNKKRKQTQPNKNTYKRKTEIRTNSSKPVQKIITKKNIKEKILKKVNYSKVVKNWLNDLDPNNIDNDKINQHGASNSIAPKTTKSHETVVKKVKANSRNSTVNKAITFDTCKGLPDTIIGTSECLVRPLDDEITLNNEFQVDTNEHTNAVFDKQSDAAKNPIDKVIEKKPHTKNKKVVQARLAERDGIMKFGLPAKCQKENKIEMANDSETKIKEVNKEKKGKSKFVPPIKSQIPVKNISFDVVTINDNNLYVIHELLSSDNDIAMVIIYKNGFSQLNSHHTEDNCVSDGIMIQSDDKFFYFKDNEQNSHLLGQLIEKCQVICYNAKQMLIYLMSKYGLELKQKVIKLFDAKIGGSLIDPDNPPENFAELQKLLEFTPEFTIATECVLQKTAWYITLLRECFDKLKSLLVESCVWSVYEEIEMPLLPVIAGMENQGVCVDSDRLKLMEEILLTKMKSVEQECYKAAGKTFQINSTLQVRTILYDELQLDTKSNLKIKETIGKGAKSTSESMLRGLVSVHPLPRLILEYRHLHKAHATFLTGIAQHVKDGSVRPTWVQMAAATGRIASNNPNLQAIPKAPFSLVVFPQDSNDQEPPLNFRSVYTARKGHFFVAADFKHIECRVFAHAAEDATLQDALRSGQDLFRVLAAKWLNKSIDEISSEDRERTKRIVYASLYGAGARKLMEILQISYEQALSVMSSFNRTFPALKSFGRSVVAKAASGALSTLYGRVRRFPHIASADAALRAQAERQAVNFIVQGSAADLCKKAMVAVQRRLDSTSVAGRLVLQIHDELVWEVAEDHVATAAAIIKDAMENVGNDSGMGMRLPVELTFGRNWGEMRPFQQEAKLFDK